MRSTTRAQPLLTSFLFEAGEHVGTDAATAVVPSHHELVHGGQASQEMPLEHGEHFAPLLEDERERVGYPLGLAAEGLLVRQGPFLPQEAGQIFLVTPPHNQLDLPALLREIGSFPGRGQVLHAITAQSRGVEQGHPRAGRQRSLGPLVAGRCLRRHIGGKLQSGGLQARTCHERDGAGGAVLDLEDEAQGHPFITGDVRRRAHGQSLHTFSSALGDHAPRQ